MTVDKVYMEILKERMRYFSDKKITDLTNEEIQEFTNLRKEITEQFQGVAQAIKEVFGDFFNASDKYRERVLNRK